MHIITRELEALGLSTDFDVPLTDTASLPVYRVQQALSSVYILAHLAGQRDTESRRRSKKELNGYGFDPLGFIREMLRP